MKRIKLNDNTNNPNFIGSWFIEPSKVCGEIIQLFEDQKSEQRPGTTAMGKLETSIKNSTDIRINPTDTQLETHQPILRYLDCLLDCYRDYVTMWPMLEKIPGSLDIGPFNIQRYEPGGHFQAVHAERMDLSVAHRVLAWMTYLNDVEDGGSTSFTHFNINVRAEKGKTLIWPAEWTHAHCGNIVNRGVKYIITGWMHFSHDK